MDCVIDADVGGILYDPTDREADPWVLDPDGRTCPCS